MIYYLGFKQFIVDSGLPVNQFFSNKCVNEVKVFLDMNLHFQITIERESGEDVSSPKHGKEDPDNMPHVGGNTWAGGTGW